MGQVRRRAAVRFIRFVDGAVRFIRLLGGGGVARKLLIKALQAAVALLLDILTSHDVAGYLGTGC